MHNRPEPPLIWLPEDFSGPFPDTRLAFTEPDGLLAAGGNLNTQTLLQAYSQGIFPWYSEGQPILWWSPNPRCVIFPEEFHVSRSLRRTLNSGRFEIRINTCFEQVMRQCAAPRKGQDGTWITDDILRSYCELNAMGKAHSVEVWYEQELVGGVYGLHLHDVFFGESMFSRMKDASKVALHHICKHIDPKFIDAQVGSEHLMSLGARMIRRERFLNLIETDTQSRR